MTTKLAVAIHHHTIFNIYVCSMFMSIVHNRDRQKVSRQQQHTYTSYVHTFTLCAWIISIHIVLLFIESYFVVCLLLFCCWMKGTVSILFNHTKKENIPIYGVDWALRLFESVHHISAFMGFLRHFAQIKNETLWKSHWSHIERGREGHSWSSHETNIYVVSKNIYVALVCDCDSIVNCAHKKTRNKIE